MLYNYIHRFIQLYPCTYIHIHTYIQLRTCFKTSIVQKRSSGQLQLKARFKPSIFGSGGPHSGGLLSRATDFGSGGPHSGGLSLELPILGLGWDHTLGVYTLGVYTLGVYSLGLPILGLGDHLPVLRRVIADPST